jgi:ACS family hexuronate transporter-like MFS transporter
MAAQASIRRAAGVLRHGKDYENMDKPEQSTPFESVIEPDRVSLRAGESNAMRWWILSLLFCSTFINYMDRMVLAILIPVIRQQFHLSEAVYGNITAAFQVCYMVGALLCGYLLDTYGTKIGMAITVGVWSAAAMLHASVVSPLQLGAWRGMLGLAEAGNFPGATKAAAEWFPPQERAFAVGVFNAGINIAAVITPPAVIAMQMAFGWQACFLVTGGIGFVWLLIWLIVYRAPVVVNSDEPSTPISLKATLAYPQAWGFAIAKFLTDPVWWFYLFWLPLYFYDVRKFDMKQLAWALPFIYLVADFGAVAGGWISGYLMRRGWPRGKARKAVMLACALIMPVSALGVLAKDSTTAVLLFSLATCCHQAWMTNLFTSASDVFPKQAVGRVLGLGGSTGGFGGVLFSALIPGYLIGLIGYTPLFLTMSSLYMVAMVVVHILMGDLRTVSFGVPAADVRAGATR